LQPQSGIGAWYERATFILNCVHGVGQENLPPVPVEELVTAEEYGRYRNHRDSGLPEVIRVNPQGPYPELTFVHEIGHYLDSQALFRNTEIRPTEELKRIRLIPDAYVSTTDLMQVWRDVIDASQSSQILTSRSAEKCVQIDDQGTMVCVDEEKRDRLIEYPEFFARSYAQYIVLKSNDDLLLSQLKLRRSQPEEIVLPRQWSDEDFIPIAEAMEDIILSHCWMTLNQD